MIGAKRGQQAGGASADRADHSQQRSEAIDRRSILWQITAMAAKLKTVHITLTRQIADLLEAEVTAGRFANLSEAVRNAAWKAFAEDPAAELRAAFSRLDESPDKAAPDSTAIAAEIRAWRAQR
jgi:Arc/MetJ-type ribon-helix-helix transcriptional regulator